MKKDIAFYHSGTLPVYNSSGGKYMKHVIILLLILLLSSCNKSVPSLAGTTWISEDGKTKLEFKTDTIVVRDDQYGGEYKVEGNIVTIGNAIVKIPLTYEDGKLKGRLNDSKPDIILIKR
jgi:hypothetical protein